MIEIEKPVVGLILYSSWGYDQTNIDYYRVVKVSDKSVWVQKLRNTVVEVTGWLSDMVVPLDEPDRWPNGHTEEGLPIFEVAKVERKIWKKWGVKVSDYANAYVWDGKPKNATHYA